MRLNWGPYLWMRCYNNGAQFLDRVVGTNPDWDGPGGGGPGDAAGLRRGGGAAVRLPRAVAGRDSERACSGPRRAGRAGRALPGGAGGAGVPDRPGASASTKRPARRSRAITVSGGIARSDLMCEILATVLDRPLERLQSFEGPALGGRGDGLAALENHGAAGQRASPTRSPSSTPWRRW